MHRYGRYGAHAWMRWHKRFQQRHQSTLLPETKPAIVTSLSVPIQTGRIIVIVTDPSQAITTDQIGDMKIVRGHVEFPMNVPLFLDQRLERVNEVTDNPLATKARWRAFKDIGEVGSLLKDGFFVSIEQKKLDDRIELFARTDIETVFSQKEPPAGDEYKELLAIYKNVYLQRFNEEVRPDPEAVEFIYTPQEIRVRKHAVRDKIEYPLEKQSSIRDLGVIRTLAVLDLSLNAALERLEDIDCLADKYESYYFHPREDKVWPDRSTFPG